MGRPAKDRLLEEVQYLITTHRSIFGLQLLDPIERIVETNHVRVNLNYAGKYYQFTVVCDEDPYDFIFQVRNKTKS